MNPSQHWPLCMEHTCIGAKHHSATPRYNSRSLLISSSIDISAVGRFFKYIFGKFSVLLVHHSSDFDQIKSESFCCATGSFTSLHSTSPIYNYILFATCSHPMWWKCAIISKTTTSTVPDVTHRLISSKQIWMVPKTIIVQIAPTTDLLWLSGNAYYVHDNHYPCLSIILRCTKTFGQQEQLVRTNYLVLGQWSRRISLDHFSTMIHDGVSFLHIDNDRHSFSLSEIYLTY